MAHTTLADRQTAAGRQFELRLLSIKSWVLSAAALGLALHDPVLMSLTALAHLTNGFVTAVGLSGKVLWLVFTPVVVAVETGVLVVAAWASTRLGLHIGIAPTFADFAPENRGFIVLTAVCVGAIGGSLFRGVGMASRLVEYQNKFGELP